MLPTCCFAVPVKRSSRYWNGFKTGYLNTIRVESKAALNFIDMIYLLFILVNFEC